MQNKLKDGNNRDVNGWGIELDQVAISLCLYTLNIPTSCQDVAFHPITLLYGAILPVWRSQSRKIRRN